MNKALKIFLIIITTLLSLAFTMLATFMLITAGTNLDGAKLVDYKKTITIYDDEGNKIENASSVTGRKTVNVDDLQSHTLNAFIASEDRNFYNHNGLNYKRMVKALYRNLTTMSFKEGASTISQQLIKNTHLSSDKTLTRKLKEIKLTRQLERRYDKNEILEMYLNTIYFGHNCYGLQKAAQFYFDKPAELLDLEQSATLAGLLSSPNNYSPFKNPEKSLTRRNLVLKAMLECNHITNEQYEQAVASPISAVKTTNNDANSSYLQAVFDEFEELEVDPYGQFNELKIKTFMNASLQKSAENCQTECDKSIFFRNNNGGVTAFSSTVGMINRQIGSVAKPLFVYAPAIEDKKLHLCTKINDEEINFGGYSPENYDKKYHGYVSVLESIAKSYNVPAVKTLNTLDFDKVEDFAKKMKIDIGNDDKNLSLALGAMKDGLSLKKLCDAYSTFPNGGTFTESHFIDEICDQSGKILYKLRQKSENVFSAGTSSLINEALTETAKSGTAKKLKALNCEIACKTGTCGTKDGNTDAYAVGYTPSYTFGVWLGDKDNKKLNITGGNDCCKIVAEILSNTKITAKNNDKIDTTSGTVQIEIDREDYEKDNKIVIADDICPKLNRITAKFLANNLPNEKSVKFSKPNIKTPTIEVKNNKISIQLCQTKYYSYLIKRYDGTHNEVIFNNGYVNSIEDEPKSGKYVYGVTPYYDDGKTIHYGEEIMLPSVKIGEKSLQEKIPDIIYKDWSNL